MKTVGIIAEYNPFHTGHEYHLNIAKELTGADYAVVVMSPDFVQRGDPAFFDKYTRTRMALACGADLVLELPVCYAAGSAEYFAEGSTAILDKIGVVDTLCFGAENDNIRLFHIAAHILKEEPAQFSRFLQDSLKQGMTFPQARSAALISYTSCLSAGFLSEPLSDSSESERIKKSGRPGIRTEYRMNPPDPELIQELSHFLETPNNILGVEYCKALQKRLSRIIPVPVERTGNSYSSRALSGKHCSAGALREGVISSSLIEHRTEGRFGHGALRREYILNENQQKKLFSYIPEDCRMLFSEACKTPVVPEDLLPALKLRLLDSTAASASLRGILDLSSALADRIANLRFSCIGKTYEEIVAELKTRQLTETRIRRALLHLILNIRTDETESFRSNGTVSYAHVLGFRKDAAPLLHRIKKESDIPLITKTAGAARLIPEAALPMWEKDLYASHFYRSILNSRYGIPFRTEYEISPVII